MAKKITLRKKITPRAVKLNKALQKAVAVAQEEVRGDVMDDKNPADQKRLIKAMISFIGCLCRDVLDYTPEQLRTDASGPLNLNEVFEKICALKLERDNWRTRCESIEAAFNALGSQSSGGGEHGG